MTRSTNEPNLTDLAAGYVLDDLSPEEMARLDRALAENPALHGEIAALGEALALLPYDMPIVAPSAGLKAKILNAASQSIGQSIAPTSPNTAPAKTAPTQVVPIAAARGRNWQRWMPAISTAIAAVAVAAVGLNQVQLSRQSQQTIALQQQLDATNAALIQMRSELQASQNRVAILTQAGARTYALNGATSNPENGQPSTAQLVAKPGDRAVTLVAQNLPRLSDNQVYRLWAVATPKAAPMYCGEFRQDAGGTAQWVAPNAACTQNPAQLLITLDAPTDPTTSAGPLVMRTLS
jgi:anti-sigma-K factor RskA